MGFFRQKESALDRRLRELDEELNRLKGSRKAAERNVAAARSSPATVSVQQPSAPLSSPKTDHPDELETGDAAEQDDMFFAHLSKSSSESAQQGDLEPNLFNALPIKDEKNSRRRFASYFMAGHFQDLQPRRHERRVQRNKAIVTIIVTLLALAWVVYWIFFAVP